MFLPIGDEPNPTGTPWVNYLLIAINMAVFIFVSLPLTLQPANASDPIVAEYLRYLASESGVSAKQVLQQLSAYDIFVFEHGFKPASPQLADLFGSMFLHGGWLHLLGNMLFLWIFGNNVEFRLGRLGYLLTYLLTGVAATVFFALFQLDSWMPLVGASGAISGILGCYYVWFPQNQVRVLAILLFFVDVIRIPARFVLGFYLIIENILPFMAGENGSGVAYGAHIGGFVGGLGIAALWPGKQTASRRSEKGRRRDWIRARAEHLQQTIQPNRFVEATEFGRAIAEQRWDDALRDYAQMTEWQLRHLPNAEDVFTLADRLTEDAYYESALAVLQRFIATHPVHSETARAHLRAGLIQWRGFHRKAAAYQHFMSTLDLNPRPEVEGAARRALAELELSSGS